MEQERFAGLFCEPDSLRQERRQRLAMRRRGAQQREVSLVLRREGHVRTADYGPLATRVHAVIVRYP